MTFLHFHIAKIVHKIQARGRDVSSWLTGKWFNAVLNLSMFLVAIAALIVAQDTLTDSRTQFELAAKSSDSLFRVQLTHSTELNHALLSQIESLQVVTSKQLAITNQQLQISQQSYDQQVYSGRPIIKLGAFDPPIFSAISDGIVSPGIRVPLHNVGKRHASNLDYRGFIVYPDLSEIRGSSPFKRIAEFEPEAETAFEYLPHIRSAIAKEFYFCIDIRYFDRVLNKMFFDVYYFHYFESRGKPVITPCDETERNRIRERINKSLSRDGQRLLGFSPNHRDLPFSVPAAA